MRRAGAVGIVTAVGVAMVPAARAQGTRPFVIIEVPSCLDSDRDEIRRIVGIELNASVLDGQRSDSALRATLTCDGSLLGIEIDDPVTRKSLKRSIDVAGTVSSVRARTIALALADLATASWAELVTNPTPAVLPAGQQAAPDLREAAAGRVRAKEEQLSVIAQGGAMAFRSPMGPLWGVGIGTSYRTGRLVVSIDARANLGQSANPYGQVFADVLSISVAGQFAWDFEWLSLRAGLAVRGGAAIVSGDAAGPWVIARSGAGPWAGPAFTADLRPVPQFRWVAHLGVEIGYAPIGVVAQAPGGSSVVLAGLWGAVTFGVGFAP